MKLNPPASSSDLESAREVARRLHELRRQAERTAAPPPPVVMRRPAPATAPVPRLDVVSHAPAAPAPAAPAPAAARPKPAPPERPSRPAPAAAPAPEPPPLPLTPPPVVAPPRQPPPPPVPVRAAEEEPEAAAEAEVGDPLSDLQAEDTMEVADEGRPADDEAIEIEETSATLEEMVSAAETASEEEIVAPPDLEAGEPASDEDVPFEPGPVEDALASAPSPFDEGSPMESMSEELFDLPTTPSWDEVVENCLMITHARGAMLIDPSGHVLASNGFWPEPGPVPIATKLVAMMEKTLKDAPTRSVSAPVGAMHLTAWRVPLAEGLITVAFLGDTPLRAETRTPVDAEILRGAP